MLLAINLQLILRPEATGHARRALRRNKQSSLADNDCLVSRRGCVFCAVVLVAAGLAGVRCGSRWYGALAVDWRRPVGARFLRRVAMHLGFRAHGPRNARSLRSASAAGGGGFLSIRQESNVCRLLRWLDGLWVVFGRANRFALMVVLIASAAVVLFVKFYEEPTLRKMFGGDYEEYCRNVPRWIPRLRAWSR